MAEFFSSLFSGMFAAVLPPSLPASISLLLFSALVTLIITGFNRLLVDQQKMKNIREEMASLQKKAKEVQKSDPEHANKLLTQSLEMTNKQMWMSMRAMFPAMLIIIVLLPWMAEVFTGPIVRLPFDLPYFGNDFGWLMWYFISSIPFSIVFRKVLGVV